jgi:hypothetical protein
VVFEKLFHKLHTVCHRFERVCSCWDTLLRRLRYIEVAWPTQMLAAFARRSTFALFFEATTLMATAQWWHKSAMVKYCDEWKYPLRANRPLSLSSG